MEFPSLLSSETILAIIAFIWILILVWLIVYRVETTIDGHIHHKVYNRFTGRIVRETWYEYEDRSGVKMTVKHTKNGFAWHRYWVLTDDPYDPLSFPHYQYKSNGFVECDDSNREEESRKTLCRLGRG